MSQKIFLVSYELEDETPLDETSEVLQSAYIPDELIKWISVNGYSFERKIKEVAGVIADISVTFIFEHHFDDILLHIETFLYSLIQQTNDHISDKVLNKKELDNDFSDLLVWLNIREVLIAKIEKFSKSENIKIIVG